MKIHLLTVVILREIKEVVFFAQTNHKRIIESQNDNII